MRKVSFQSPDESALPKYITPDEIASFILQSTYEYWQQGGNGEGSVTYVGNDTTLLVKETERNAMLLTLLTSDDQRVPYSGGGLRRFCVG